MIDNDEVLFCHFSKRLNTTLLMSYSTAGANFSSVRNKMSLLDKCRYMQLCLFDRQTKFKPLLVKTEIVGDNKNDALLEYRKLLIEDAAYKIQHLFIFFKLNNFLHRLSEFLMFTFKLFDPPDKVCLL